MPVEGAPGGGTAAEQTSDAEERLRDLQALTDTRLGQLDVDDLLVALLERVLVVLDADTAAVLLLDERAGELVARAARGIEEEVRQGVRIPVGRGFAGRVAADQRPVIIDHVDPSTVTNPILWETGIKAMAGVPLLVGGKVIGVLHVGTRGTRKFTAADAELLQVVADRVASATQARELEVERAAARALQRSLLPSALPSVPNLAFAARYLPAGGATLGGDWYDVFALPSGQVWLVAGDVGGHGFRASVVMGRLRSTVRAYALEGHAPDEALELADRKLQHFEPDEIATVACATLVPPFDEAVLASAGHPPAVLACPSGATTFVHARPEPPLGAGWTLPRTSTRVALPPGALLVLYTDGLVERRDEPMDEGLERLRTIVTAEHPNIVCRRLVERLVGGSAPADDVAIVAVARLPST
ncbi:MAG: SpoIIE family protein phosphatase [Acidimicrobiia bacterium]|nr:SpoIIE family protein phosphatase [Acidimicrobiia bacterium]